MIKKAFILGAGLGTRLQPLTHFLPKPLVPLFNRPMIMRTLEQCYAAGIREFAINTHHLPDAWEKAFPDQQFRGCPVHFFHEEKLLETGGGLKNIETFFAGEPVLVYNGDILSTLPLQQLIDHHLAAGLTTTLALRSNGPIQNITVEGPLVTDLRNQLSEEKSSHQFTGIYITEAKILDLIPAGEKISVIPAFLELAKKSQLGACCLDDGDWFDIGTVDAYREIHTTSQPADGESRIHPEADIHPTAEICNSIIGSSVPADCKITDSIIWPDCQLEKGATITSSIITQ
ncbi:sugar phosphate nucleotidyltransferase [Persicirhabdus sediminis]|uniref:NTP transferase domain-containing protein n=1 Tax=Persicirhabdus sediminis TaxID=454144 RepID=A0A8J7MED4_9BACT|nr:sugar phosphate nucleotidyltransferase [Persicirhabdus sediminis]MBK1791167.1 NTP transferase domain-containing protein [Persicirhabdus sediminis]